MSESFSDSRPSMNDYYESLAMDSPVVHSRNYSRFSHLADRSRSLFLNELNDESTIIPGRSNNTPVPSLSMTSNTLNLSNTLQLPTTNTDSNDLITEDEMARLVIFESFFELNQKFILQQPEYNIFDLMKEFQLICEDNLHVYEQLLDNKTQSENQLAYFTKFSNLIRLERNIWCLLKALLIDRFSDIQRHHQPDDINRNTDMEIEEDMRLRLNDSELIERALQRNAMFREMQIVIDWLESVNVDEENGSLEKIHFYSDGPGYWENTLHNLKISSNHQIGVNSSILTKNSRNICTEMDPDGPIRNGQILHDLDKEDENRLFHYLFKLVRSGRLPESKAIAERFGYFWLSAALDGWIFHNDPNYSKINEQTINDTGFSSPNSRFSMATFYSSAVKQLSVIDGNPYRDLWKHSAWKCSKMEGTNLYERALFAVFSGNRSVLMPLCTKWMDKLWAYFKCSLDVHLENFLIDSNISKPDMQPRINIELPDQYWDNRLTPEEIFHELETQTNLQTLSFISKFEEECYRVIVKCIILSKIDLLIDNLYEWSKTIQTNREARTKSAIDQQMFSYNKLKDNEEYLLAKIVEPNLLRLFAHVAICLNELNLLSMERHSNLYIEILEIYIGFLIEYKLVELIAFYTTFLPQTRQVQTFGTLLETIDEESDRRLCLIIAKNAKLNISAILSLVVENIRLNKTGYQLMVSKVVPYANFGTLVATKDQLRSNKNTNNKVGLLSTAISEDDKRKINALDWLLLDGDNPQYLELLWQANALIRTFLLEQKIDQALETHSKLPSDIVIRVNKEYKLLLNYDFEIEAIIREYLSHSAYFEASEAFKKWHQFLYTTKPQAPLKPKTPFSRIADRVLHEQRLKQYKQDLDIWRSQIKIQAMNASKKLLSFLRFPSGIWMDLESSNILREINEEYGGHMETDPILPGEDDNSDQSMFSTEIETNKLCSKEHEMVIKQQLERKRIEWKQTRPSQLDGLRRIYVPQFIFLLQSVYRDSGNLKECIRVADLLADVNLNLYATFTKDQLSDFLSKTREVAIEILQFSSDPFGCENLDHEE